MNCSMNCSERLRARRLVPWTKCEILSGTRWATLSGNQYSVRTNFVTTTAVRAGSKLNPEKSVLLTGNFVDHPESGTLTNVAFFADADFQSRDIQSIRSATFGT